MTTKTKTLEDLKREEAEALRKLDQAHADLAAAKKALKQAKSDYGYAVIRRSNFDSLFASK